MSDTESLDYLQKGFEPSSLTVPRLRSILVAHNIPYPSGAKKPQLIEIFVDNVLPQSRRILSERSRARRTSRGITDADSQESTVTAEEELMPPPQTRTRTRRTPAKVKSEESESDAPSAVRSPVKRTPRQSTKHARASDTDTAADADRLTKSVRKSRKPSTPVPAITPRLKTEDEDEAAGFNRRDSAFTYDNPFQSGSSPLAEDTSPSGERKRRSVSSSKDTRRRKSTSQRRTETPQVEDDFQDDFHPPTSATFEIPISQLRRSITPAKQAEPTIEPTEEFTPEAQLELVQERIANGLTTLPPPRRRPAQQPSRVGKGPIWVVLLTLLGGYSTWYRQEKVAVGYCGVGRPATQIIPSQIDVQVPDWARILVEPECEPCPQHAYCSANLETHCEVDFVLKPHPLSLGGLVPLTPTCEPDGEKVRRVQAVADKAVEELRERKAKFECGDLVDEAGVPEPTPEIVEEILKKAVSQKRRKGMGEAEFEELWAGAIGEILGRDEVVSNTDGTHRVLSSTSLARVPIACAIRRSFRLALAKYRLQLSAVASVIAAALYIRSLILARRAINSAVPHLVSITLDRLASQAALHAQDKETYPESWISIGQLRDDVLRDEHSVSKREKLWQKVRNIVEMNANIRSSQRESRSGEISRVWEWIGHVESGGDRERRRKSGRVSWGVYDEHSSPVSGMDQGPKWEESRPIY